MRHETMTLFCAVCALGAAAATLTIREPANGASATCPVPGSTSANGIAVSLNVQARRSGATVYDLSVKDLTGRDRALSIAFDVPVGADAAWQEPSGRDVPLAGRVEPLRDVEDRSAGLAGVSRWPFGAVRDGARGVALGIDAWTPACHRVEAVQGRLAIVFDVGLAPERPEAALRFTAYDYAAADGWRGALAAYQALYPEAFRGRAREHGQWMPFAAVSKVRGWEDFGFKFKEGHGEPEWDDAHGIYTFTYNEPCTWWMDAKAADGKPESFEKCLEMAEKYAAGGNATAKAWRTGRMLDADGAVSGLCLATPWCIGAVWSVNSAPFIAGDPNFFELRAAWTNAVKTWREPFPKGIDGEYVDSAEMYVTPPFDFNRAHFAGMRTPLSFTNGTFKVGIFKGMVAAEYVREVARRMHALGRLSMANATPERWCFLSPYLDVMGTESDWTEGAPWAPKSRDYFLYRRAHAGTRPFCLIMNSDFSKIDHAKVDQYMQRSVAFGFFPGFFSANAATGQYFTRPELYERDRPLFKKWVPLCKELSEAGWRPVNVLAKTDDSAVWCEQFGDRYCTVYNDSAETKTVSLVASRAARERVTGADAPCANGRIALVLPPLSLRVLDFGCAKGTVEVVDCPKCKYYARFSDDGKSATVNRAHFADLKGEALEDAVAAAVKRAEKTLAATAVADDAVRPLMGWSSWNCFATDINEEKIVAQARAMATNGLKAAGFRYVNVDDGFFGGRDAAGHLRIVPERFPKGLKGTADGIHAQGLKAGIYSDAGDNTCASGGANKLDKGGIGGGLWGHDADDCNLFFNVLGFDFIKVDSCGLCHLKLDPRTRYTEIANAIRATGRTDVRLNVCRWAYPGTWVSDVAGSWRVTGDIRASWKSIRQIVLMGLPLSAYASRGHYNDLDMLELGHAKNWTATFDGDGGLTPVEETAHFGLWCIMSSPLVLGCDLRTMPRAALDLVTNPYLVGMNANGLGLQAYPVSYADEVVTLVKDADERNGLTRYVAVANLGDEPANVELALGDVDLAGRAWVVDLVEKAEIGSFEKTMKIPLKAHEAKFYRVAAERRVQRRVYRADCAWMRQYHKLDWEGDAPLYRQMLPGAGEDWDMIVAADGLGRRPDNDLLWRDVRVEEAGDYDFVFTVLASDPRNFSVSVDGKDVATLAVPARRWTQEVSCRTKLSVGDHEIRVFNDTASAPAIVQLVLEPAGPTRSK